jgi:putative phage-type endonuclease
MSLTDEQRKQRSRGLGGSDIGAMLGLSKWKSPMDLWAQKTGRWTPDPIGDKDIIIFGNLLETIVADEFARRLGKTVHRVNKMRVHEKYDFMLGSIDRRIVGERALLEVKTSSAWLQQEWGESGTDDVPLYYLTQGAHYMEVFDYDVCYFAVLIGGNEFRWYRVERDADVAKALIEKEAEFWRLVLTNTPPDALSYPDVARLYPKDEKAGIVATDAIFRHLGNYELHREERNKADAAMEESKMHVCDFMGTAGRLTDRAGAKLASWLAHPRNDIDVKKLKAIYPEIYEELTVTTTVRPFRT